MKCQITRSLVTLAACLLVALSTVAVGAEAPPVTTAAYYDDLMAQQDAYFQTLSTRTVAMTTSAAYDDLLTQQDAFFRLDAMRSAALVTSAYYDDLMAQQDAYLQSVGGAPTFRAPSGAVVTWHLEEVQTPRASN